MRGRNLRAAIWWKHASLLTNSHFLFSSLVTRWRHAYRSANDNALLLLSICFFVFLFFCIVCCFVRLGLLILFSLEITIALSDHSNFNATTRFLSLCLIPLTQKNDQLETRVCCSSCNSFLSFPRSAFSKSVGGASRAVKLASSSCSFKISSPPASARRLYVASQKPPGLPFPVWRGQTFPTLAMPRTVMMYRLGTFQADATVRNLRWCVQMPPLYKISNNNNKKKNLLHRSRGKLSRFGTAQFLFYYNRELGIISSPAFSFLC